ncbi:peptidase inhibitor family I36 protein [Streptomyces sp. NPDC057638]|uniref:peptidase inhibitor family I36 protein n=1 Tax=Streptomyces sp. NPDC057638 TaxID=3346190 RepID=UPI0036A422B5
MRSSAEGRPSALSRLKHRTALLAALAILTASAGVLANTTPAQATEAAGCMGNGRSLCLRAHENYGGFSLPFSMPNVFSNLGQYQDQVSSIVNDSIYSICFYEHPGYGGLEFRIGPWEWWPSLPGWINDKISSFRPC